MCINIFNRLINLNNATDIGVKDNTVTVYYGNGDYWSSRFKNYEEALEVYNEIAHQLGAKDIIDNVKLRKETSDY
jgi:hypothetical protein